MYALCLSLLPSLSLALGIAAWAVLVLHGTAALGPPAVLLSFLSMALCRARFTPHLLALWFGAWAVAIPHVSELTAGIPGVSALAMERALQAMELFPLLMAVALLLFSPRAFLPALPEGKPGGSRLFSRNPSDAMVFCRDAKNRRPVAVSGNDRYLNTLIVGPIGSGKSSRMLAPLIWQELRAIKESLSQGVSRGMTVLEPKGDLTDKAALMCRDLEIPYVYINPLRQDAGKFNPLEGDPMLVAEATRTVLRSISGRQEAFFALSQEIAARNTILLLKYIRGDKLSLPDVSRALRDPDSLKIEVAKLEQSIREFKQENMELAGLLACSPDKEVQRACVRTMDNNHAALSVRQNVVDYFKNEVFGSLKEKTYQFVTGLRLQFDDLAGNELLFHVISPRIGPDGTLDHSSDISLDEHLAKGGVLLVNTASNNLGRVGDAFGRYVLQHLQGAVFRRPGDEKTRPRHTTIIDELATFVASDFERMLSNGRSYRNENIVALQSTAQLVLDDKKAFRETIMNLCRNKVFFGGMDGEDARYISKELGDMAVTHQSYTYGPGIFGRVLGHEKMSEAEKDKSRFSPTVLMELPPYHVAYKIVSRNRPEPPGIGVAELSEWDKRQRPDAKKKAAEPVAMPDLKALIREMANRGAAAGQGDQLPATPALGSESASGVGKPGKKAGKSQFDLFKKQEMPKGASPDGAPVAAQGVMLATAPGAELETKPGAERKVGKVSDENF